MLKVLVSPDHLDYFIYNNGNNTITKITQKGTKMQDQTELSFGTVEEAETYFNTKCGG